MPERFSNRAFGISEDGTWTREQEERFAVGFEDFLRTGRAEDEDAKTLYRKIAEFLSRVYKALKERITFTPEIDEVYNALLKSDGSELALAEKAVKRAEAKNETQEREQKTETAQEVKASAKPENENETLADKVLADENASLQEKVQAISDEKKQDKKI